MPEPIKEEGDVETQAARVSKGPIRMQSCHLRLHTSLMVLADLTRMLGNLHEHQASVCSSGRPLLSTLSN